MAKIFAICAAVLFLGSCVPQTIPQAPAGGSRDAPPGPRAAPPAPSGQAAFDPSLLATSTAVRDSLLFLGRSIDEVTVAAKIGLADCRYAIKSSDPGSRLIIASRTGADPAYAPTATVQVFADASGAPGVKILVAWPGPAGNPPGGIPAETERILAAIWNLLR